MNDFKVPLTHIKSIRPHPNADRLEIATVYGWDVIIRKGQYTAGSLVLYVPPNSVLPSSLEAKLFPPESKITLDKGRVKAIKIRGFVSTGVLVDPTEVDIGQVQAEQDYAAVLGITKYEAAVRETGPATSGGKHGRKVKGENPNFRKYGGLTNFKWCPDVFGDADVIVTEKIHGTNFRAGYVPRERTLWEKVKGLFYRLVGKGDPYGWEFVWGSNNVQLQRKEGHKGYYSDDVYREAVDNYNLEKVIPLGVVVYGEVYGNGVQKGYDYGNPVTRELVLFDAQIHGKWLTHDALFALADRMRVPSVPVLYRGPFKRELIEPLLYGNSTICPTQKVREGIVIKNEHNYSDNRIAVKWISPDYTMREATGETTDFQ